MPFVDPTHLHFVSQVLTDGTHTPITPGGQQSLSLLGPFTINFDDDGLVNPVDLGIGLATIPAGSTVRAYVYSTAGPWTLPGGTVLCYAEVTLSTASTDSTISPSLGDWDLTDSMGHAEASPEFRPFSGNAGQTFRDLARFMPRSALLDSGDKTLIVAVYTDGDAPTAGTADVYAVVATVL